MLLRFKITVGIQPYQYNHKHEVRTKWPPLCNTIFFYAVSWLKICEFQNEIPLGAKASTCRVYSWRRRDMATISLESPAIRQYVQNLLRLKTIQQRTHQSTAFEIHRPLLDRRKINYEKSLSISWCILRSYPLSRRHRLLHTLCVSIYYQWRYYQPKMVEGAHGKDVYSVCFSHPCTFRKYICVQLIVCSMSDLSTSCVDQ